jgi:MurNAc alpha-1-phosphate uridylyltransferase
VPKSTVPIKAMILAAGRGKRLRPLTDKIPKPLVSVHGKPLIEYHLEKLQCAGVKEVVINHAWLGEQIERALGNGDKWGLEIHYSAEPEGGLETAGGIINVLDYFANEPFIVVNGDVYSDFDYEHLISRASNLKNINEQLLAHLILVPNPEHNPEGDFSLMDVKAKDSRVMVDGEFTFAGISLLHPALFDGYDAQFLSLAPILREAMNQQQVTGELFKGYWSDVGTLERLAQTEAQLATGSSVHLDDHCK